MNKHVWHWGSCPGYISCVLSEPSAHKFSWARLGHHRCMNMVVAILVQHRYNTDTALDTNRILSHWHISLHTLSERMNIIFLHCSCIVSVCVAWLGERLPRTFSPCKDIWAPPGDWKLTLPLAPTSNTTSPWLVRRKLPPSVEIAGLHWEKETHKIELAPRFAYAEKNILHAIAHPSMSCAVA